MHFLFSSILPFCPTTKQARVFDCCKIALEVGNWKNYLSFPQSGWCWNWKWVVTKWAPCQNKIPSTTLHPPYFPPIQFPYAASRFFNSSHLLLFLSSSLDPACSLLTLPFHEPLPSSKERGLGRITSFLFTLSC